MKTLTKTGVKALSYMLVCSCFCSSLYAAGKKNTNTAALDSEKETRYPIGCRPVGYEESLKVLSLFPGKEGALQSMYFFYNKLPETVSLYQMRDKDSEYSTRYNHSIRGGAWAVLAVGEPHVKFICSLGDGKKEYGKILDCAETIKVCEYVNVKFGLNNKGNYWIVDSNTRNGAVNEVVHYGIIPGV
ncbi:endopeptidase IV [Legionella sp. km772]|uniref:endopeptidase IV n=1 Tax=Legionella sp. km772 TaxID=2498111 RepID=UPI000F8E9913|nr:endopeptidase IV [Legionella sp. km772]RUR07951.1 endopeptidase IV [Legionella sp. km772]